ncbi:MAG TPA: cytochrome P450 [Candidatus Dormibacteraeota bacterium]|nr:cytochrome P450 [Candidatus Dormibacteraeota bacterium]
MELNPFSYGFQADPYPTYRWLRDHAPVYRNQALDFFALSRWDDVLAASLEHDTYSSAKGTVLEMDRAMIEGFPIIIFMDPPRQTRLRRLVSKAFTPARINALDPFIRRTAIELVEQIRGAGRCDFIADFAARLPIAVISAMIGVPAADRDMIREWTDESLSRDADNPQIPARALAASARLGQYFYALATEKRAHPGDDMTSLLAHAEFVDETGEPQRLTDAELVGFCSLLSAAGNETVTKLLGNAIVLLARHPDQRRRLVEDPRRIPEAVEECLRYWPPSQYQGRTLMRDVTLHGVTMPRDAFVLLLTGAACRDERQFPDADRFDITRDVPVQLAFGHGAHKCLGAALARLESRIALEELHARIPDYGVDESACTRVHMSNVHGFASVPMAWS